MGSITPILTQGLSVANSLSSTALPFVETAGKILGTVKMVDDARQKRAEHNLALQQVQQKNALEQSHLTAQTALDKQKNALELERVDSERRAALKRAMARQRAEFGASGIGSGNGSSQAVLLGMFDESEDDFQKRAALDNLRSKALDQGISQNQSLGLLQAAQLAERNKLARYF